MKIDELVRRILDVRREYGDIDVVIGDANEDFKAQIEVHALEVMPLDDDCSLVIYFDNDENQ